MAPENVTVISTSPSSLRRAMAKLCRNMESQILKDPASDPVREAVDLDPF